MRSRRSIDSQAIALIAAQAAIGKQAEGVVVMDLRALSSVTDFFILCTAGSSRQIAALKDHIEAALVRQGCPIRHTEGTASVASGAIQGVQWVLMDCGDLVVHLFNQQARALYRLEELWADAPRLPLPPSSPHALVQHPQAARTSPSRDT